MDLRTAIHIVEEASRLVEVSRPETIRDAGDKLAQAGYRSIGFGSYSEIFSKPGDPWVLKLFDADDSAFLAFIDFSRHCRSPHFPVYKGKPLRITDAYYAIRMEKLTDVQCHWWRYLKAYFNGETDGYSPADDYMKAHPSFKKACDALMQDMLHDFDPDIKPANIMQRNGTLVLVDPIMNQGDFD